jgi:hypothetical protein
MAEGVPFRGERVDMGVARLPPEAVEWPEASDSSEGAG